MQVLGIYAKQPIAGQVKTRLAKAIGTEAATELYRAFLLDLAKRFCTVGDERYLCYSPNTPESRKWFQELAGEDYQLWPQPEGSLEPRLQNFFEFTFGQGATKTVVIGSDSPALPKSVSGFALGLLQSHDCVLGPATDGGYYLLGLRKLLPIFNAVDWSTPRVLDQTVAHLENCQASLFLLPPWYDVDTLADLPLLKGHLRALSHSEGTGDKALAASLSHTQQVLKTLKDF